MIIIYIGDYIIISKTENEANKIFTEIDEHMYKITDEGTTEEYLGILITYSKDSIYMMSQAHLIESTVTSVPIMIDTMSATIPAAAETILTKHTEGEKRKKHWKYRLIISILNYLVNCTNPEILLSLHQFIKFCNDNKYSHEHELKNK